MKIKIIAAAINPSPTIDRNTVALAAALAKANGRASAHTADLRDLADAARDAEAQLASLGLPVTRRVGARAQYLSGGKVASAYKYPRLVTHATLERGTNGWFLVGCVTVSAWPADAGSVTVSIPSPADEYLVAKLHNRYGIIRPAAPLILDDLLPIPVDVQAAAMASIK